ncbi:MAG: hypothetical protein ACTSXV_00330 [Alphaproteobacteria bacterium]
MQCIYFLAYHENMTDFDTILSTIRKKIEDRKTQFEQGKPFKPLDLDAFHLTEEMVISEKMTREEINQLATKLTKELTKKFNMNSQSMQIYGILLDTLLRTYKKT